MARTETGLNVRTVRHGINGTKNIQVTNRPASVRRMRMNRDDYQASQAWQLLSWENELQWFASKTSVEGACGGVYQAGIELVPQKVGVLNKRVMGGRLRSMSALVGTIKNAEALGWDLYLQLNPSRFVPGRSKLARADITHW